MSNLQNTLIKEKIWEHLEILFDENEEFNYDVSMAAQRYWHFDPTIGEYKYRQLCWDFLSLLSEWMGEENHIPYSIEDTEEIALSLL